MRAEPDASPTEPFGSALECADFGLLLFDRDLNLVRATAPAATLLPDLAARLVPGTPCSALFAVTDRHDGGVDLALRDAFNGVTLNSRALPEGGVLVTVRLVDQWLSNAVEAGQVGIWEWDVTTGQMRVNDRLVTMLGYTRADLEPIRLEGLRRLLRPADQASMADVFDDLMLRGMAELDNAFRLRHADGSWVWVQSRGRVLRRDPSGLPTLMAGVHTDITAQKISEQRLEQVLEGAQAGTWQFHEVTRKNEIDARWAEMLGYRLEDLTGIEGDMLATLMHPEDRAKLQDQQDRRLHDGAWKFDNEIRMRHKDGHWVWILSRGQVTEWTDDGKPLITSGVHIDISDRHALAEALAQERDFLAGLMETSISGIMAMDAEGRVIFANHEAEIVMARPAAELLGRSCSDGDWGLSDSDGTPLTPENSPFYRALSSGQVQRGLRLGLRRPDGSLRHLLVNSAPLTRKGISASVVCAVADITDAVAAEATLRAAMERAEAGNRAKSEFLATMSHEIRTPLNGVLGMADLLAPTLTTPEQREMIETIQQSGAHLLSVLNDILDLAKIESGRMVLENQPFVPAELARRIEALHRLTAAAKGVDLVLLTDTGAGHHRSGDAQRVLQVLHNLVGNAVKFTPSGEVRLVMTARDSGPIVIEVTDTGIGMTPDQVSRVFDDFIQADSSITRRFGGSGLGLPIVHRLVTLMGGAMTLDSTAGQGTRVRVELPLPTVPRPAPETPAAPRQLSRLRALVAEDNATNRVILRSMLGALGMNCTLAEDGDEAVERWQPDLFDILLLDISMPRGDGLSALRAIRARAEAAGAACPPALAVTANAMTHHVAEYTAAGFAGCVAKPIRVEDLAMAIAQAVSEPQPG